MTANGEMEAASRSNFSGKEGFKPIVIALENLHYADGRCAASASIFKSEIPIARRWNCFQSLFIALVLGLILGLPIDLHAQTAAFTGQQTALGITVKDPRAVALDSAGDLFFEDDNTAQVVEVPAGGGPQITIGQGFKSPIAVAVDSAGNIFIADFAANVVWKVYAGTTTQGTLGTGLSNPSGVAVDAAGDVFIADYGNDRVVELPAGGGAQTTLAGSLDAAPEGIAADAAGDVFIADDSSIIEVPAGGTPFTLVKGLNAAVGVAVDGAGNVFISESTLNTVLEFHAANSALTTVASGLDFPLGIAVNNLDQVFIGNYNAHQLLEVQPVSVSFGTENICPAGTSSPSPCSQTLTLNYSIASGGDIATGPVLTQGAPNVDFKLASGSTCVGHFASGSSCLVNVTFAPTRPGLRQGAVQITDDLGNVLATTNIYGIGNGPELAFTSSKQMTVGSGFSYPVGVAFDAAGDTFVADFNTNEVYKVAAGSGTTTTVGTGLSSPAGVAVDGAGDVFIADQGNFRVVEVPAGGGTQTTVGDVQSPVAVAVNGAGDIFIADLGKNSVLKVPASGGVQTSVGTGLLEPQGVAVDASGNVFIADSGNNRVVEVPYSGGAQTTVLSGLAGPTGVSVDAAGDVFIADYGNNRVLEIDVASGTHSTLGTGLKSPTGVAVDSSGDVLIADTGNARVLEFPRSQPPAFSFAATDLNATSTDSPQSVVLENIGNQTLSLTGISFPVDFPEGTGEDLCSGTSSLAPGQECNLPVDFTPLHGGSLSETLKITDNALNATSATQSIVLSGTGIASQVPAAMTSPTPGSTLTGPSVTFKWTAATGPGNQGYWLFLGTTGVGSKDLYDSGQQVATSATFGSLPTNGEKIYARVYTRFNGVLVFNDYTYTAWMKPPVMTSPAPGSTLTGTSATFTWAVASSGNQGYWLFLGTAGAGSKDLYDSGQQTATSATFSNLPTNGITIYARVYTRYNGVLVYNDYTYSAWRKPPVLTSPSPGSTLTGASVKFTWTAASSGNQGYWLFLGTTGVGSKNLFDSGQQTATSATVNNLPTNGETIYARVYTRYSGVLVYNDYTYKAK